MVGLLFVYPLLFSLAYAFRDENSGGWYLGNFTKAFALYGGDISLTVVVTVLSTVLVGVLVLGIIANIMNLTSVPGYHQQVVMGVIIVVAILAQRGSGLSR